MIQADVFQLALEAWGSFFCLIIGCYILYAGKHQKDACNFYLGAILVDSGIGLAADATSYTMMGDTSSLATIVAVTVNYAGYVVDALLLLLVAEFIHHLFLQMGGTSANSWRKIIDGVALFNLILLASNPFSGVFFTMDDANWYYRGEGFWVISVGHILVVIVLLWVVINRRKDLGMGRFVALLAYVFIPTFAGVMQVVNYGTSLFFISTSATLLLVALVHHDEQLRAAAEQSKQLARAETQILLGQIKPHFINNTLAVIRSLCEENPQEAIDAIDHLSRYLQVTFERPIDVQMVSLEQELDLVRNYLFLENRRFDNHVQVQRDLQAEGFQVPALSIQPLVENSVRHGIRGKRGVGTLRVATREEARQYVITIADDGVGFDPKQEASDERRHLGIETTRRRIQLLTNGTLTIESTPGTGTTAVITLPKGGNPREISGCG